MKLHSDMDRDIEDEIAEIERRTKEGWTELARRKLIYTVLLSVAYIAAVILVARIAFF